MKKPSLFIIEEVNNSSIGQKIILIKSNFHKPKIIQGQRQ